MKDKREQTQLIVANKEIRETRFGEFFNLDAEALWEENQKYSFFKRKRVPVRQKHCFISGHMRNGIEVYGFLGGLKQMAMISFNRSRSSAHPIRSIP